ncbi:hypothetical protein QQP08_023686 [Theobroma cacao]|nr:hypothetical protein QQP08_023686 [Theobroma cacao]
MENLCQYLVLILFMLLTLKFLTNKRQKLPPSPFSLPIIGHLHLIKNPLYAALRVLVVSSPSAIEECFTKNDIIFANRPQTMAGDILTDKYVTIAWAPYGDLWRNLRRLSVVEIFSANSLQRVRSIREEEVRNCVQQLSKL